MDVAVVVYVRRARGFVVKSAVDSVCQHRNELPLTERLPNNTVENMTSKKKNKLNKEIKCMYILYRGKEGSDKQNIF